MSIRICVFSNGLETALEQEDGSMNHTKKLGQSVTKMLDHNNLLVKTMIT